MAINLIRKNNQPAVTAYHDATVFHMLKGHDYAGKNGGVFSGVNNGFGYITDAVNKKFIVKSGMGMLYGRQFELSGNETVEFALSSFESITYGTVYVEVNTTDDENETAQIKCAYSSEVWPTLGNTDIYKNKTGIATMPLYRFTWIPSQNKFELVIKAFYEYRPGVAEKGRKIEATGVINNRKVGDLIEPGRDYARHAMHAVYSDMTSSLGGEGNNNQIDNDLKFVTRNTFLLQTKQVVITTPGKVEQDVDFATNWVKPSGTIIGLIVRATGYYYMYGTTPTSIPNSCGYVTPEVIDGINVYMVVFEQTPMQPVSGIIYTQATDSWLKIAVTSTTITITPLYGGFNGSIIIEFMVVGS